MNQLARPAREADLPQILALQRQNLETALGGDEAREQGFVTVVHDLATLSRMHALAPSIVAERDGRLVGYAIMMPVEAREWLPVLKPMFAELEKVSFRGRSLAQQRYYTMGQICVAK